MAYILLKSFSPTFTTSPRPTNTWWAYCQESEKAVARADAALTGWVARQELYASELFSPAAVAATVSLLDGCGCGDADAPSLTMPERRGMVDLLRQMHAATAPARCDLCAMVSEWHA
jgi:hypothetical protein